MIHTDPKEDTMIQAPHYRKSKDGEWVVAGPSNLIYEGATVTVVKRDRTGKTELIERVGREYYNHGVKCRYGYIAQRSASSSRRVPRADRCRECGGDGQVEESLGQCAACGADYDC